MDVHLQNLQILEMLAFDPSSNVNTLCQLVFVGGGIDWCNQDATCAAGMEVKTSILKVSH